MDVNDLGRLPPSSQPVRQPLIASESLVGLTLLVVDDTPDNRLLIKRILLRAGAEVDTASDGKHAITSAATKNYDAIVMDMQMPGMNGTEILTSLQAKGIQTPVLALTGAGGLEEKRAALSAGFVDYLLKPVEPDVLVATVARCARG